MTLAQDLALAHTVAAAADRLATSHRASNLRHWVKEDGTALTELDLAIEKEILTTLTLERPQDTILAEESGIHHTHTANARRWLIDPLDGTLHFLNGGDSWGTHIALEEAGQIIVAILTRPTRGLYYWAARGEGAWLHHKGNSTDRRLHLSAHADLATAKVVGLIDDPTPLINTVQTATRWVTDEPMVIDAFLEGRVDALLDVGGNAWDQAPLTLLVREAMGCYADPYGGHRIDCRFGLYSGNPRLHEQLWRLITPYLQQEK